MIAGGVGRIVFTDMDKYYFLCVMCMLWRSDVLSGVMDQSLGHWKFTIVCVGSLGIFDGGTGTWNLFRYVSK